VHTKFVKTNKNAFKTLFVANHNTKKYIKIYGFWIQVATIISVVTKELFSELDESFYTSMMLKDKTRILTIKKSRIVI